MAPSLSTSAHKTSTRTGFGKPVLVFLPIDADLDLSPSRTANLVACADTRLPAPRPCEGGCHLAPAFRRRGGHQVQAAPEQRRVRPNGLPDLLPRLLRDGLPAAMVTCIMTAYSRFGMGGRRCHRKVRRARSERSPRSSRSARFTWICDPRHGTACPCGRPALLAARWSWPNWQNSSSRAGGC
jgi:hypothetical protein